MLTRIKSRRLRFFINNNKNCGSAMKRAVKLSSKTWRRKEFLLEPKKKVRVSEKQRNSKRTPSSRAHSIFFPFQHFFVGQRPFQKKKPAILIHFRLSQSVVSAKLRKSGMTNVIGLIFLVRTQHKSFDVGLSVIYRHKRMQRWQLADSRLGS